VKGTKGASLVDGLEPQPEDQIIVKYRFSAFFGTNLHSVLCRAGIKTLVVLGVKCSTFGL
jgi:nicotinamidase-related amidase